MIGSGVSAWSEMVLIGPVLDMLFSACTSVAVAHLRATCSLWRQQCDVHLKHMQLVPMPALELRFVSSKFPHVRRLSTCKGRPAVTSCWSQTKYLRALTGFAALEALTLDHVESLTAEDFCQLQELPALRFLSLPNACLEETQLVALVNSTHLTSLLLGDGGSLYMDGVTSACTGALKFLQSSLMSFANDEPFEILRRLSWIQSLSISCQAGRSVDQFVQELKLFPNVKHIDLYSRHDDEAAMALKAVCKLPSIAHLKFNCLQMQDLSEGFSAEGVLCDLTAVSSLQLSFLGPKLAASLTCMTWLLSLSLSSPHSLPTEGLCCISYLERLTCLHLSSPFLIDTRCTFLQPLTDLAACSLQADFDYGCMAHGNVIQYGSDVLFCLTALRSLCLVAEFAKTSITCDHIDLPSCSNLCCLEYRGPGEVSMDTLEILANLTLLSKLTLFGDSFSSSLSPFELNTMDEGTEIAEFKIVFHPGRSPL